MIRSLFPPLRACLLAGAALALPAVLWPATAPATPVAESREMTAEDARLNAFFEEAWRQDLARDPEMRTKLGLPGPHDRWTVMDETWLEQGVQLAKANLERLRRDFDPARLSDTSRLSHRLFEEDMQRRIDGHAWRLHRYTVSQLEGAHTDIPSFLILFHEVKSAQDGWDYIRRLERVPEVLDATVAEMRRRADKGVLPPAFSFPNILTSARNVIVGAPFDGGADSPLFADFKEKIGKLDLTAPERERLIQAARTALSDKLAPAYRRFIAATEEMAGKQDGSRGVWALPDGDAFYRAMIKEQTTLPLDPEEVHQLGLQEVARLHEEMRGVMGRIGFQGSLQDFFHHLRTAPETHFPDTPEGKKAFMDTAIRHIDGMRARLDEFFGVKPKADVVVRQVEPFREHSTPSAFYEQPSPDGSRPGVFYANLSNMSVATRFDLEALAYHEGIPGHHMQIAIAQERTDLPMFRRFGDYNVYAEGWALYTERLAKEHGFYPDPYSDAGRIASELFRAARLVLDTGIHHKRWTREQAIEWMNRNTANALADNVTEIERYFVWPGQALGYKIGMNRILELREKARAELGSRFDLRGFHDVVLANGAVSLPVLEEIVRQWIAARSRAG